MVNSYSIDVVMCEESGVFVGTSKDIPGLTLESDTLGGLLDAVMENVPQLLQNNLGLPQDADVQVTVRIDQPTQMAAQGDRAHLLSPASLKSPRYVVEERLTA